MAKYVFEVTISGRVNVMVEAESEQEAKDLLYESPDFPNLDKTYGMEIELDYVFE